MPVSKVVVRQYTGTVESAVDDARTELESLRDELDEWRNNIEEHFSTTQKYADLESAVGQLDALDSLPDISDLPEKVRIEPVSLQLSNKRKQSRSSRCDEAVELLRQAASLLLYHGEVDEGTTLTVEEKDACMGAASEIQSVIEEIECVEFPGMF